MVPFIPEITGGLKTMKTAHVEVDLLGIKAKTSTGVDMVSVNSSTLTGAVGRDTVHFQVCMQCTAMDSVTTGAPWTSCDGVF